MFNTVILNTVFIFLELWRSLFIFTKLSNEHYWGKSVLV